MKSGIDYFPLDVTLDEKFELIEAQFGLKGFAVMIKILQKIYGGEGYYAEWTTEIALLFAKRIGTNGSAVSDIVSAAIKRGIFDKTLYDKYQILTSSGIQKRYFEAVSRRKNVKVKREYLLFNVAAFLKNVDILQENVDILQENVDISQQSKVKESKVKESKVKESKVKESKVNVSPPIPPQQEEIERESGDEKHTEYSLFLEKWGISDSCLSNYNAGKVFQIDWNEMSKAMERSSNFLQKKVNRGITFFINQSDRILAGEFDDDHSPHNVRDNSSRNVRGQRMSRSEQNRAVYMALKEKYRQEEELNYADDKKPPN